MTDAEEAPSMIGIYAHVRGDRDDEPFTGAELFDIGGSQTAGVRASFVKYWTASRDTALESLCVRPRT